MKICPKCGAKFNWWQRATGENKEHIRNCHRKPECEDLLSMAAHCRGCPAGCFDGVYDETKESKD
ncbi:MAG: hypothetical protein C4581_12210 [Nitrospiraceae bacterium]|nr:MAG: hypothetical protein C4581_12210 [Nitrospiraceae bacterium]